MITAKQKELISATVPVLREHGVALTTHFYNRMFTHHPELKNLFNLGNQQSRKQQTALAMAVLAYAEHIDDPTLLSSAVSHIGHKHRSLDIRPEQYAIVGKHLLASIGEVLGEAATPELLEAWAVAYGQLARIMQEVEANLYEQAVAAEGGWSGWRPFLVRKKVKESQEITSFYLYPADGGKVAHFLPGQYVSVRLYLPQLNLFQPRQYSLSNAPNGEYYRISVKRETGADIRPDGMISNQLHDTVHIGDVVEMASPAGDFILDTSKNNAVVLISGGVGQTPLVSMVEYLISTQNKRDIVWIHGARNRAVHAFEEPLTEWARQYKKFKSFVFYDELDDFLLDKGYHEGMVDLQKLHPEVLPPKADYYLCGPAPFIEKHYQELISLGIPKTSIYYEEFGPQVLVLQ